jgi:hypothetical protein
MVNKKYENGDVYEGFVDSDEPHGYGVMNYVDGSLFEGEWNHGKTKSGKMTFPDGVTYEGGFKNDLRHGKGVVTLADKTVHYSGMWKDDVQHGFGIMIFDESKYIGHFENGEIKGEGKFIFDVATFIGTWENSATGYGSIYYTNGDFYFGKWVDYKKEGDGYMVYADSSIYNGDWVDDKQHGIGFFLNGNKELFIKGQYENDQFVEGTDMVTITKYENGDFYDGEYDENDRKEGIGFMVTHKNEIYKGDWKKDEKNGEGIMRYPNKDLYEGEWKKDNKSGGGTMRFASGVMYNGRWLYDKPFSDGSLIIQDVVLRCKWNDEFMISEIVQITNINKKIISIVDILPFLDGKMKYNSDFYTLVGLYTSPYAMETFKRRMLTYTGTVMIAAICHGWILPPIPLPIPYLHRINKVVNGVCGFSNIYDKLSTIDTCISNDISSILPVINKQFQHVVKRQCNESSCNYGNEPDYFKMFHNVRGLTESPQKLAKAGNLIFNKEFTSKGKNVSVLLVKDEEGNYINLLSEKDTFTLEELFTMIPQCSKCILVDSSCSGPGQNKETGKEYTFTKEDLESYGGTRKKRKNRKRTIKNKNI